MAYNFDNLLEYFTEDNDNNSEEETPKKKTKKISSCHDSMDIPVLDSKEDSNLNKSNNEQENSASSENNEQKNKENEPQENIYPNIYDENEQFDDLETDNTNYNRLYSFRPEPIPSTPKISINENYNENNLENLQLDNKNENEFAETIKTKIEGEENDNTNHIRLYSNKNVDDEENLECSKNIRDKQNIIQSFKVNNLNNLSKKDDDDSEKEEEEFLKNEEIRIKKIKENSLKKNIIENKNDNNENDNIEYKFKDAKEEEEAQLKYLREQDEKKRIAKMREDMEKRKLSLLEKIKINKAKVQSIISKKSGSLQEIQEESVSNRNLPEVQKIITSNDSNSNNEDNIIYRKEINFIDTIYEKNDNEVKISNDNEEKIISNRNSSKVTTNNNSNNRSSKKNIENNKDSENNSKQKITNNDFFNDKNIKYNTNSKKIIKENKNKIKKHSCTPDKNLKKLITPKNKRNLDKNNTNTKTNKNIKNIRNDYNQEYSFHPKIDKKSEQICKQKNINNSNSNKKNLSGVFEAVSSSPKNNYINCRTENSPICNSLYENASTLREKMKKLRHEELDNIKRNMNKTKTNKKSNILFHKTIAKNISKIVNKYHTNDQVSIVNTIQILFELNILHELLRDYKGEIQENNMSELIMQKVSPNNVKAQEAGEEIDFVEQFWMKLNPNKSNKYINKQILIDVLKLLFSFGNNFNDEDKITALKNYLNEDNYNKYDNEFDIEVWNLEKLIKVFMELKSRNKNYQNVSKEKFIPKDYKEEEIIPSNPIFNKTMEYYYRNTKDNKYLDTSRDYKKISEHDFNKTYANFMYKQEMQKKTLEKLREQKEINELKMCYKIPKINKTKKCRIENSPDISNRCPRYEYLYKLNNEMLSERGKKIIEKENEYNDKEKYPFKPKILQHNKSFIFIRKKKPKGFEKYVERTRSFIKMKEDEKIEEENKRYGRNYDKIMASRLKSQKFLEPKTDEKAEKKDDEVFFNIDVKIGNEKKPLKIFKGDDVMEKINNFCQMYKIGYNEKKKILKKIKEFNSLFQSMKLNSDDIGNNINMDNNGSLSNQ